MANALVKAISVAVAGGREAEAANKCPTADHASAVAMMADGYWFTGTHGFGPGCSRTRNRTYVV